MLNKETLDVRRVVDIEFDGKDMTAVDGGPGSVVKIVARYSKHST